MIATLLNTAIINISSVAAVAHIPFQAFYSASKAAISSYSCALDNEVKPYGIQVTAVELGDIHTGFTQARQKVIVGDKEYGGRISRSVSQMEKDEQNGASPEVIGAYIAKIIEKKFKPICVAGAQYKFLSLLCKLLPCGLRGKIVGAIYATNETAEQMPIPFIVATKFLQLLKAHPSKMFRADAKAQVSYDYDTGRITTFLCSVQHSPDVEVSDFRHIIESMMALAACEYGLDGDFTKLVNPTGRFVLGGSYHLIKKCESPSLTKKKTSRNEKSNDITNKNGLCRRLADTRDLKSLSGDRVRVCPRRQY